MRSLWVIVFSCSSLAVVCLGGEYRRTVSYETQVLVKCIDLHGDRLQYILDHDSLDIWKVDARGCVDFRVEKEIFQMMKGDYPECKIAGNVEDIVRKMEIEMEKRRANTTRPHAQWFEEYHRYDEILTWYQDQNVLNKYITEYESIGMSLEGREQPAFRVTSSEDPNILKIYFQCQNHAREWISGAICMYIANWTIYGRHEPRIAKLLDKVEFIFIPFVNPDGYEVLVLSQILMVYALHLTWTNNRLWRKNRRKGTNCDGVDLNRNYNVHWGEAGSSPNECSETYHGTAAESEPETKNTASYFKSNGPIIGAVDWHSYGQLLLRPYGWTTDDSPDEAQLKQLGDDMSHAIRAVHGKTYTSQKAIGLYKTTGTARDWFYSDDAKQNNGGYRSAGYTIELRDTGQYGFELPPDQIIPTGEEIIAAVIVFVEELLKNPITS